MIESMTGFGRGAAGSDTFAATVEIRSVNSRFCEVTVRVPRTLGTREAEIGAIVKRELDRGKINVNVQLEQQAGEALSIRVDPDAARAYRKLLDTLREAAGIREEVRLDHLLRFSDVFTTPDASGDPDERAWEAAREALMAAIDELRRMRRAEGQALQADLEMRVDVIERQLELVEIRSPLRIEEARARLHERLRQLVEEDRVDPNRLEFEIAVLADRLDVTEECVRLRSHLNLFREALRSPEAVGRRLNFLAQEINREVNTIGSKANDAEIAQRAVTMKEELERIREQVQNIE